MGGGAQNVGSAKGRSQVQCVTMTTLWVAASQTELFSACRANGPINRVVTGLKTRKPSEYYPPETKTPPTLYMNGKRTFSLTLPWEPPSMQETRSSKTNR